MDPEVSVIIPAYNVDRYITEAIQSVLEQSYSTYKIIVVDDGSTDNTLSALKRFHGRINIISKSNGGPASARNLAIKTSSGELIAFLDGDDLWTKNKLERQVETLAQNSSAGLIYSEALMFCHVGFQRQIKRKIGYTVSPSLCKLLLGDFIPNSTVVIRRSCIEKIGLLDEDKNLIAVEDYEYWMRTAKFFRLIGLPWPSAYYRIQESNLMGEGQDIDSGLRLSLSAIHRIESVFPEIWETCEADKDLTFARLYIRAGFAWKQHGFWIKSLSKFITALNYSFTLKTLRWITAAILLKRWS